MYAHKNLNLKTIAIVTLLFFGVSFLGIYFHEIWMDESHHFLLGRDSNGLIDLYKNTRYDGHPILWNYLIYLITRLTYNPFYMQLLHITISSFIVYIFLKKTPFSLWFKIAFVFSYFMIYEYTIISRNYNLGILFLFLACTFYAKREHYFNTFCFFLALSCNTHSIFSIVACSLLASVFFNQFTEYKFSLFKKYWKGYLLFFTGLLLAFYQIIPKSDTTFFNEIDYSFYQSLKSVLSLFKAFFPIVDFTIINYWNQFYLINNFTIASIFLGCISCIIPLVLFNKNKTILFFVYLTFGGFILFEIFTQRYGIRYNGLLFITIIIGFWMMFSEKESPFLKINISKFNSKIILTLMLLQVFGGIIAYGLGINKTFNHGKNVASFIKNKKLDVDRIITVSESASINAFLPENLYNLLYQKKQGYYLWNKDYNTFYNKTEQEIIQFGFNSKPNKHKLYFILNSPLASIETLRLNNKTQSITLVKKFEGAVKNNYYVYLIKNNEKK